MRADRRQLPNGRAGKPEVIMGSFCLKVLCEVCERKTNIFRPSKRWLLSAFNWRVSTGRFGWGFPLTHPEPFTDRPVASITSDLPVIQDQTEKYLKSGW